MPSPNVDFHIKIISQETGQAAGMSGTYIDVLSGTAHALAAWTEIAPGIYVSKLNLPIGEYVAQVVVPFDTEIISLPFSVEVTALDVATILSNPETLTVSKYLGIRTSL